MKENCLLSGLFLHRKLNRCLSTPLSLFGAASLVLALVIAGPGYAQGLRNGTGMVAERYQLLCANCHGQHLEGAQASSLLDEEWLHGGDDESIARSIRTGFPDKGMPAWGTVYSEADIRSMVIFVREMRARFQRERTVLAKPAESITATSRLHDYQLNTWVEGLAEPWSLAFLPDHRALITEKRGTLRVIENGRLLPAIVTGVPVVDTKGQAGLFDVVPHPDYAENGWLYFAYADPQTHDGKPVSLTRIIRGRLKDGALVEQQSIFQGPLEFHRPAGGVHFGGRIVFDHTGYLYFTIGERGDGSNAQKLDRPTGKIHRVFDDGRIPPDNPFVHDPKADHTIWTYGHRNPQGLAVDPATGDLYDVEHGPRGGDEVNLARPGRNYGWPVITYGMNYDGTPMTDITAKEGMEQPVTYWVPSIAPCGANFYSGTLFPKWKGHLFVASLAAQELRRLEIKDGTVLSDEVIFKGLGRIRDVVGGPDGALYVLLPNRIARLTPVP